MPITDNGYQLITEEEYRTGLVTETLSEFPNMSTNDANPLVVLLKSFANEFADTDAYGQEAYNNVYVLTASGDHLDQIVKIAGISRLDGTRAVADITFVGNENVPISPATRVQSRDGFVYATTNATTIYLDTPVNPLDLSEGYYAIQQVIASLKGSDYNLSANTINQITNPISGLTSVTNENPAQGGTDEETDADLRSRYFVAIEQSTGSSIQAIINNVLLADNVTYAFGNENFTNAVDSEGLPAKSFNIVVEGGVNEDIAQAIFEVKPCGIESYGAVEVDIDFADNTYPIYFDRAIVTPIYYEIEIQIDSDYFTSGNIDIIKNNIIGYTDNNLILETNRLIGLIYRDVDGVVAINTLKFDRIDPPVNTADLTAQPKEKFTTDSVKVVITTVEA